MVAEKYPYYRPREFRSVTLPNSSASWSRSPTVYLTDHPDHTRKLLPKGCLWRRGTVASLNAADRRLWKLLGASSTPWYCEAFTDGESAFARRVLLIDRAAASQFSTVNGALQKGEALPDSLVCLALTGTGFRGQHGRSWMAVRGNLHLTARYGVRMPAVVGETGLMLLAAVATARTVEAVSEGWVTPTIKWINDILVSGYKVAGVLTETQIEGTEIVGVVFGVGMNVQRPPELAPSPVVPQPAALADFQPKNPPPLRDVFHTLVEELDAGLRRLLDEGPDPLFREFRSLAGFIGRRVRIWPDHGGEALVGPCLAEGRVLDLLPDLSLVIEGQSRPLRRGRMELVEER